MILPLIFMIKSITLSCLIGILLINENVYQLDFGFQQNGTRRETLTKDHLS